jgi:hypothetical protein
MDIYVKFHCYLTQTIAYLGVSVLKYINHPWFGRFFGPDPVCSQDWSQSQVFETL